MGSRKPATKGGRGARQRILDTAAKLFYLEGINTTGVERLAAESAVSKRTLYQHFPSKKAIVEEYLRGVLPRITPALYDPEPRPPRERLMAAFAGPSAPAGAFRGCPFHNAAVEVSGTMPEVADIVRSAKCSFVDTLAELAAQAGVTEPRQLADELAVLYEGAAALSTSLADISPWAHARTAAEVLIDHALAH